MITFSVSLLQLGIFFGAVVIIYIITRYVIGFLSNLVFGSTWFVRWQIKKKRKTQSLIGKSERETLYNRFQDLGSFIDWLDKSFPNSNQRKQFWRDWTKTPIMRKDYINKFLNQYAPEVKVIKKVKNKNCDKTVETKSIKEL